MEVYSGTELHSIIQELSLDTRQKSTIEIKWCNITQEEKEWKSKPKCTSVECACLVNELLTICTYRWH